ncbi:MAG: helix-turn-helix domain-containing protein [Thermonemataceae bacterium]
MELGEKIRAIREMKGYSQTYLATHMNISQTAYSKIERGETQVTPEKLQTIADILEVPKESIENFSEKFFINITGDNNTNNGNSNINSVDKVLLEYLIQRITLLEQKIEQMETHYQAQQKQWLDLLNKKS